MTLFSIQQTTANEACGMNGVRKDNTTLTTSKMPRGRGPPTFNIPKGRAKPSASADTNPMHSVSLIIWLTTV